MAATIRQTEQLLRKVVGDDDAEHQFYGDTYTKACSDYDDYYSNSDDKDGADSNDNDGGSDDKYDGGEYDDGVEF